MTLVIKANKWPLNNTVPDTTHDFMLLKLTAVLVEQSKEAHYTIILKQHCVAKVFKQLNSDYLLSSDGCLILLLMSSIVMSISGSSVNDVLCKSDRHKSFWFDVLKIQLIINKRLVGGLPQVWPWGLHVAGEEVGL